MNELPPGHHFYECSKCGRRIPNGSERMVEGKKKYEYVFVCKDGCEKANAT